MINRNKRFFKGNGCREILSAVLSYPFKNPDDINYTDFINKVLSIWVKKPSYGNIKSAIFEIETDGYLFWIMQDKGTIRKIKNNKSTSQTITDAGTGPNKYGYLSKMKKINQKYYITGYCNQVYQFEDNNWVHIDQNIITNDDELGLDIQDIISNNSLICAVGNEGQIFIQKNKEWQILESNTKEHFYGVCIDNKGDFWATGSGGIIVCGNDKGFKIVCECDRNLGSFWDIEFYNNQIVVSGSKGIYAVNNQKLEPFNYPVAPKHSAFKLINSNDRLWSLGDKQNFCLYNGVWEEWEFNKP
jgi:hypothetical protein